MNLPSRAARIGSVPYLNARPLTYAVRPPVVLLAPSALSRELHAGRLDVGLVPVMEALEHAADYWVVDDVAIGSLGEVFSVYLTHRVPILQIKTVGLDPASRTSVNLVQVLLENFHGIHPTYLETDYHQPDAEVIIGDPAIVYRLAHPEQNYLDLAGEWRRCTGLPFVFAVWAIRKDASLPGDLADELRRATAEGLAARSKIAANEFELYYLTRHLHYGLGPEQKAAIEAFSENLVKLGKLKETVALEFV